MLRLIDAFWIAAGMWLACRVYPQTWQSRHEIACLAAIALFYCVGQASGIYISNRGAPLRDEITRVWSSWGIVCFLLVLAGFVTHTSQDYSRIAIGLWFIVTPLAISGWRFLLGVLAQELRSRGHNSRKVAIVGVSEVGLRIAQTITVSSWMGLNFIGFFDDRFNARLPKIDKRLGSVVGNFDNLVEQAREGDIDRVYIALPPRAEPRINGLIHRLGDTTASVYIAYDFGGFDLLHARWSSLGSVPVLSVVENPFYGVDGWVKRIEDIILGCLILTIIAIPMAVIALAVKLTSAGPVFFRQHRYGLNGERIRVLKFRTMTVCEDGDSVVQAHENDTRITPIGHFLRRTSLDELPQFLNVLTGEMSIVGPRPHAVVHNEAYRRLIQNYMVRHKVKPGITGWAQVNGWRGATDTLEKMEKRVAYDLEYIRSWGLWLDLKIILMTVFGSASKKNAY
ncbi:MAG: undecaprenyl-phosphate glucose phosphotransferase [Deltaproteobacteria bacterium]|nr:undecaprenyl-phosphate glucose phosphotransferase [Deltaproteobacteria bacterium]